MRVKALLIILSVSLLGCGQKREFQDAQLMPYLELWKSVYGLNIDYIDIRFDVMPDDETAGYCQGNDKIRIDKTYWNEIKEGSRKALIFHELGHCVFNYEHDDTIASDKCPVSYMYSYVMSDYCWTKRYPNW